MSIAKKDETTEPWAEEAVVGFDVVCTIGSVEYGHGDVSLYEAAFALIARHEAPGRYSFPLPSGDICSVVVTHEPYKA